jgi:hypothetical protein
MPVERPWAELLVNADDLLMPYLAVMASIESLHRMTRDERDLDGLIVPGSDHLTAYNLYAEAYQYAGRMGTVYGLPRHIFDEERIERWAERRGALVKSIEDAALGMASVYRAIGLPLPSKMLNAGEEALRSFQELLAGYMPFTLVMDEQTSWGDEARVSKTSVCGSWGAIAGELRYFADKFGNPRASIEGTQIPYDLLRRFADVAAGEVVYDPNNRRSPLALRRRVTYQGFELERDVEAIDEFPAELADRARHALAEALARGEARHHGARENQDAVEAIRETYRRSGGKTPRLNFADLTALYERQLANVSSLAQFKQTPITIDVNAIVPAAVRERYASLPSSARVRDRDVEIHYDIEENAEGTPLGVARLRLPEKLARTLTDAELPTLDRPLRFIVTRGARGAARASSLADLQEELERPFTEQELAELDRSAESRREERRDRNRDRRARESGEQLKDHRRVADSRRDGRRDRPAKGGGRFRSPDSRGGKRKRRPRG